MGCCGAARPAAGCRRRGALSRQRRGLQARPDPGGQGSDRPRAGDRRPDAAQDVPGAPGQRPARALRQCARSRRRADGRRALDRRLAVMVGAAARRGRDRPSHPLPADHRARDRRRRRAQLAVQAGRRRQPGRRRAGRGLPLGDRRAQDRAGHAELHQSADAPDHQGRAGRGDGPGPLAPGTARHLRQGHGERRAAVARRQHERAQGGRSRPRLCPAGAERQARLQGPHQRAQRQSRIEGAPRRDDRRADRLHRRDGACRRPGGAQVRRLGGGPLHLRRRHRAHADAACRHRLQDDDGCGDRVGNAGLRTGRHAVAEGPRGVAQDRSGKMAGAAGQPRCVPAGPARQQGAGAAQARFAVAVPGGDRRVAGARCRGSRLSQGHGARPRRGGGDP